MDFIFRSLRIFLDFICWLIGFIHPARKGQLPAITDPLLLKPAVVLAQEIRSGKLKSVDVINAYFKRIKQVNGFINAVVEYDLGALEAARLLDERIQKELNGEIDADGISINDLPLIGVPFTCKDSIAIKGISWTAGLVCRRNERAERDAELITNLRRSGAIFIALTNVPEALLFWDSNNNLYGRTCNPYDLSRIPGGSSGGEGSIISAAGSIIGVGTDIGGSIRMPAHFCGIFGHKTSQGVISSEGKFPPLTPEREHLFSVGPMARNACDLVPMLKAMGGPGILTKLPKIDDNIKLSDIKIFYMMEDFDPAKTSVSRDIKKYQRKVIDHFKLKHHLQCKEINFELMKESVNMWKSDMQSKKFTSLTEVIKGGKRVNYPLEVIKSILGYSDHTLAILYMILIEYFPFNNAKDGLRMKDELKKQFKNLLGDDSVFIFPCHPQAAPKHGTTILKSNNCGYTTVFNLLSLPVTQCPVGLNSGGLPVGLQVVANPFNDHLTLAIAREIDKEFGGWTSPSVINC